MACGDETGMGLLYDGTLGHVYGLALRVTRDADAAEDVVAETYLQVWQQAGRYDGERGTPLAWLLNITRAAARSTTCDAAPAHSVSIMSPLQQHSTRRCIKDNPLSLVMALERERGSSARLRRCHPSHNGCWAWRFSRGSRTAESPRAPVCR